MVRCIIVWPEVVPPGSILTYNDIVVGHIVECEVIPTQVHLIFDCTDEEYEEFRKAVRVAGAQHYERFLKVGIPT